MKKLSNDAWLTICQAALIFTLCWCLYPVAGETMRVDNVTKIKQLAQVPAVNEKQLREYLESAHFILRGPSANETQFYTPRPEYYFTDAAYLDWVGTTLQRFVKEHPNEAHRLDALRPLGDDFTVQKFDLEQRYRKRFGDAQMLWATKYVKDTSADHNYAFKLDKPVVMDRSLDFLLHSILPSIMIMFLYFGTRLKRQDKMKAVELPRWIVAAVVWPLAMFVYPTRINPLTQAREAMRYAVYLLTAVLSGMPVAYAKVMASGERSGEKGESPSTTLVLSDMPIPKLDVTFGLMSSKLGPNGAIFHTGAVANWNIHADLGDGYSFTFAGTRGLHGSQASDENDWMGFKAFTVGHDTLTLGAAYYDIRPLGSTKGGDMLGISAGYDHPFDHGLTGFAYAEYDPLTEHNQNAGYTASIGLRGSWNLGDDFTLGGSIAGIHADGPFKAEEGNLLRFDASISHPVGKRASLTQWVKAFMPVSHFGNRSPAVAVGVGMSFATN